jgi:hypothetical protein
MLKSIYAESNSSAGARTIGAIEEYENNFNKEKLNKLMDERYKLITEINEKQSFIDNQQIHINNQQAYIDNIQ